LILLNQNNQNNYQNNYVEIVQIVVARISKFFAALLVIFKVPTKLF